MMDYQVSAQLCIYQHGKQVHIDKLASLEAARHGLGGRPLGIQG